MEKKFHTRLYSSGRIESERYPVQIDPQPEPEPEPENPGYEYFFTLPDDFLPPVGYLGKTDFELKNDPTTWAFDSFRHHRRFPKIINLPATVYTLKKENFVHSNEHLIYWANNCCLAWFDTYDYRELSPDDLSEFYRLWAWLSKGTEVITNHKGVENGYYDPVRDVGGSTPIGIDSLSMERDVLLPVDLYQRRIAGQVGYLFETLDGDSPPPNILDVNYRTHRHLFSMANIAMAETQWRNEKRVSYLPNGKMGIHPFPHGWGIGAHTPLPKISKGVNFGDVILPGGVNLVATKRISLKPDGTANLINYVPNPYNLEPQIELR